jgi:hypothetical protein
MKTVWSSFLSWSARMTHQTHFTFPGPPLHRAYARPRPFQRPCQLCRDLPPRVCPEQRGPPQFHWVLGPGRPPRFWASCQHWSPPSKLGRQCGRSLAQRRRTAGATRQSQRGPRGGEGATRWAGDLCWLETSKSPPVLVSSNVGLRSRGNKKDILVKQYGSDSFPTLMLTQARETFPTRWQSRRLVKKRFPTIFITPVFLIAYHRRN